MLAVADAVREILPETIFLYVGVKQGLEAIIVPRNDIKLRFAGSMGLPSRKFSFQMFKFLFTLLFGTLKASLLLVSFRPDVIVASGGFVSAPSVFASALLRILSFGLMRIPVYLHEQNAVPGRMNLAAGRLAAKIGLAYPVKIKSFPSDRTGYAGYPVRMTIGKIDRATARKQLNLDDSDEYVLVFGGSQGARTINRAFVEALPLLAQRKNIRIIHASGTLKTSEYNAEKDTVARLAVLNAIPKGYKRIDYLHDLPVHLAAADLAVIRAGAGSLQEICAGSIPAIVIPKANLPGDSQVANARQLADKNAIDILYEEPVLSEAGVIDEVKGEVLAAKIIDLLDSQSRRNELSKNARAAYDPDAATRVAKQVINLALKEDLRAAGKLTDNDALKTPDSSFSSSPTLLRRNIERAMSLRFEDAFSHGRIEDERLAMLDDHEYLRYRGAALLVMRSWQQRNEGIKLLGLTRHSDRLDLLLHVLTDRTKAPRLQCLLGGDYYHVGFERRNAISSLAFIGEWNEPVYSAISKALTDPYYEARSAALKFIRTLEPEINAGTEDQKKNLSDSVEKLTHDHNLEVKIEAIHTFGFIGDTNQVINICEPYLMDNRVPVREAVLNAFSKLLLRSESVTTLKEKLIPLMNRFLLTSVAVYPHFPIKERYSALLNQINEKADT